MTSGFLSKEFSETIHRVFAHASNSGHEYVTVEHLLLGLLRDEDAAEVLIACGADTKKLSQAINAFFKDQIKAISPARNGTGEVRPTMAVQRILNQAGTKARHANRKELNGADVLAALFSEEGTHAVFLLEQQNINRYAVVSYLSHGETYSDTETDADSDTDSDSDSDTDAPLGARDRRARVRRRGGKSEDELALTLDLNKEAMAGRIDPLIGRKDELERIMQILCRRRKNNPLLIGEPGVGKTAVVEGLALAIQQGDVPEVLKNSVVHSLDVGALLAGTRYRGDFEERFKKLLKNFVEKQNTVLFIDEVHTVIGAGAAHGSAIDISNLLKPLLGSGRLRCIGATTTQEYRQIFERDKALARRFQKMDIGEPSTEESYQILCGLRSHYEDFHHVKYTNTALRTAVDLSARYIGARYLPDKALDVIDEAGAARRLSARKNRKVGNTDIEHVISKMARIPQQTVNQDDRDRLSRLESVLKLAVFGQDHAIDSLVAAVKLSRAGLRELDKTIGSYLFAGPTGVGKTELSRQLAQAMDIDLVRFDMSEYQERHTVSRLIGAPPGYVGYQEGGQLTDAVLANPHCVLLLDEIEKAHPEVYNLLLQVMDNGMLTDSNGRQVDFRNVIMIMTSNVGAADWSRRSMGFAEQDHTSDIHQAIEKLFTPEFRNRLDATILFRPLDERVSLSVAHKFIVDLQSQLDARKVTLEAGEELSAWLVKHGYNSRMGARPMKRLIQEHIKKPLAEELLFGKLRNKGSKVRIRISKDKVVLRTSGGSSKQATESSKKKTDAKTAD